MPPLPATPQPERVGFVASERRRKAYLRDLARLESEAAERMLAEYQRAFDRITRDLDRKLGTIQAKIANGLDFQGALAEVIVLDEQRAFVRDQINRFAGSATTAIDTATLGAAQVGAAYGAAQLAGLASDVFLPNPPLIEQIAARTAPGTALAGHLGAMGERVAQTVITELVQGGIQGTNPRVVTQRIRATLQTQVPHLQTLVRTETLGAAREAQLETYRANRDVVTGWIWNAAADKRTCAVCWAMNGSEHALEERFSSHPNCRCTPEPRTITYQQILGDQAKVRETSAQPFSGDALFRRQPPLTQYAVLGPSKFAAFDSGALPSLDVLVARTSHPFWGPGLRERTLGELGLPRVKQIDLPESVNQDLRIRRAARDRVAQARKAAPTITASLEGALDGTTGRLEGLAYAVKGADSLERKIRSEILESQQLGVGISTDMAVKRMMDVNRYTIILDPAEYTQGVIGLVGKLEAHGYTFPAGRWKNTWEPGKAYRGLNTTMMAPDGTPIEVQFHTRQSFDTKMASHAPYEEARLDTTSMARREELTKLMADAAAAVEAPAGWQTIMTPPSGSLRVRQAESSVRRTVNLDGVDGDMARAVSTSLDAIESVHTIPATGSWTTKLRAANAVPVERGRVPIFQHSTGSDLGVYLSNQHGDAIHISISTRTVGRSDSTAAEFITIHEYGHFLDGAVFKPDGAKSLLNSPLGKGLRTAIRNSPTYRDVLLPATGRSARYMRSADEVFARSYAQWIAIRSRNPTLLRQLRERQQQQLERPLIRRDVWQDDEFAPIAREFDALFRSIGAIE